jgi:mono/diheme cytochrome c family protein
MSVRRVLLGVIVVILAGVVAAVAYAWHGEIAPIEPPQAQAFSKDDIRRGADLAAIGNCATCHTTAGGKLFAGGLPISTPFGTIYSTNITPDPDTGIGHYSEVAFQRALRQGVDRRGRHLYPAFPYDHFTLLTDADDKALYAFLMTRKPVRQEAPANALTFPLNFRMLVAGWKLLFFHEGPFRPDSTQTEAWNRGAYLAEGLAHCGACHTPRNALGAEARKTPFAGGEAEGWTAYALNADAPAPIAWNADALFGYLRRGWHPHHGIARGPMAPVTASLSTASDDDVRAIATYVASIAGPVSAERQRQDEALLAKIGKKTRDQAAADSQQRSARGGANAGENAGKTGAAIYAAACATCHESARPLPFGGVDLRLSTGIHGPTPQNVINVVMDGLPAAEGARSPIMPSFAAALTDRQMTDLLAYLRSDLAQKPPWQNIETFVRDGRARHASVRPAQTGIAVPPDPSPRGTSW